MSTAVYLFVAKIDLLFSQRAVSFMNLLVKIVKVTKPNVMIKDQRSQNHHKN